MSILPRLLLLLLLAALVASTAAAPAAGGDAPIGAGVRIAAPAVLSERLAALRPDDALPYFLLAEEVMEELRTPEGVALARRLFVLAYEIDRRAERPRRLSVGALLALAALAEEESEERRWLLALAENAGARSLQPRSAAESHRRPDAAALELAEALGNARAGEGRAVREALAKDRVGDALERAARAHPAASAVLDRARNEPPCPGCRNRRIVRSPMQRPGGGSEETHSLCPTCGGNPGPSLSAEQLGATLAMESALLGAEVERFSADLWLNGGAPFHDPDPDDLGSYYGVDRDRALWAPGPPEAPMPGRWVSAP